MKESRVAWLNHNGLTTASLLKLKYTVCESTGLSTWKEKGEKQIFRYILESERSHDARTDRIKEHPNSLSPRLLWTVTSL